MPCNMQNLNNGALLKKVKAGAGAHKKSCLKKNETAFSVMTPNSGSVQTKRA